MDTTNFDRIESLARKQPADVLRTTLDVLDAQTALANTQKDLYKARYDVIVGSVRLRQAAGTLQTEALADLNRQLFPTGAPAPR